MYISTCMLSRHATSSSMTRRWIKHGTLLANPDRSNIKIVAQVLVVDEKRAGQKRSRCEEQPITPDTAFFIRHNEWGSVVLRRKRQEASHTEQVPNDNKLRAARLALSPNTTLRYSRTMLDTQVHKTNVKAERS